MAAVGAASLVSAAYAVPFELNIETSGGMPDSIGACTAVSPRRKSAVKLYSFCDYLRHSNTSRTLHVSRAGDTNEFFKPEPTGETFPSCRSVGRSAGVSTSRIYLEDLFHNAFVHCGVRASISPIPWVT